MIPGDGLAVDGDGTAGLVAPVDVLAIDEEGGSAGDVSALA